VKHRFLDYHDPTIGKSEKSNHTDGISHLSSFLSDIRVVRLVTFEAFMTMAVKNAASGI
jgi:hypothetical protein